MLSWRVPLLALYGLLLTAQVYALDFAREDFGIIGSANETLVTVPCGVYNWSDFINQSGNDSQWVRYRAATNGCVQVWGGYLPAAYNHYIIDGVLVNSSLNNATDNGAIFQQDYIGIENSEFAGNDVYTGVPSCTEAAGGGTALQLQFHNFIWINNSEIHGFSNVLILANQSIRFSYNYVHNSNNGVGLKGKDFIVYKNVFWMIPNHLFTLEDDTPENHSVYVWNNLAVDTQESAFIYGGWLIDFRKNTWWDQGNQSCGVGLGLQFLDRSPTGPYGGINTPPQGPINIRDSFMGTDSVDPARLLRLERNVSLIINYSDYNYLYRPEQVRTQWARQSWPNKSKANWTLAQWQANFSFDLNSNESPEDPLFANATIEPIPANWSEAWERFRPAADSPLCGSASDGGDRGAVSCAVCTPSAETCDGADNDCDGLIDEDFDADGDGYFADGACNATYTQLERDCDDTNSNRSYNFTEVCGNAVDEDCSGTADLCACAIGCASTNCSCNGTTLLIGQGYCCTNGTSSTPCTPETITKTFRNGVDGYAGAEDAQLQEGSPDTPSTPTSYTRVGQLGVGNRIRLLIIFNGIFGSGGVPLGSNITNATLYFSHAGITADDNLTITRLLRRWDTTTVTWNSANTSTNWASPGAGGNGTDRAPNSSDALPTSGATNFTFTITNDVQNWSAGGPNYGHVVETEHPSPWAEVRINAVAHTTVTSRPLLSISYRNESQGLSCDAVLGCDDGTCDDGDYCPSLNSTCSDTACYEPTCTDGCGLTPVQHGGTDESCQGTHYCDGNGNCIDRCSNGVRDGDETGTDCGGSCDACSSSSGSSGGSHSGWVLPRKNESEETEPEDNQTREEKTNQTEGGLEEEREGLQHKERAGSSSRRQSSTHSAGTHSARSPEDDSTATVLENSGEHVASHRGTEQQESTRDAHAITSPSHRATLTAEKTTAVLMVVFVFALVTWWARKKFSAKDSGR
ncbi:DNRLRE domain-containing protein [Candidatus Woesearchaeota archaeon]|nr:MAG: DNRLRE domain-containing protein [Candidatus Woesearchaeota archaeon]